jgi:hypothetical protein
MLKFSTVIVCLSLVTACTPIPERRQTVQTPRPVAPLPVETMSPKATQASPSPTPKATQSKGKQGAKAGKPAALSSDAVKALLQQAEDKAMGAASLGQSAQTKEDWKLVIEQWKKAIALLQQIPPKSPQIATVQQRLTEYRGYLAEAQQASTGQPQTVPQPQQGSSKGRTIPLIIAPGASPSPSPTASPTTSPTASPTSQASPEGQATPTGSPTPAKP